MVGAIFFFFPFCFFFLFLVFFVKKKIPFETLLRKKEDAALGAKGMGQKARRYGSPQPLMESLVQRVNDRLDLILFIYTHTHTVYMCVWCVCIYILPSLFFSVCVESLGSSNSADRFLMANWALR